MKKSKMVKTELDDEIFALARLTDHRTLVIWACDCADRVLPYFENKYPKDLRPSQAITSGRKWIKTGIFKMTDIRHFSLAAHASARDAEVGSAACSAARAAGQAVAAAHASGHAIVAAIYAATAVRDGVDTDKVTKSLLKERQWQQKRLLNLRNKYENNIH